MQWSCTLQPLKVGVLGSLRLLEVKNISTSKHTFPSEPEPAAYFVGSIPLTSPSAALLQSRNYEAFRFSQFQNNYSPLHPSNPPLWLRSIETRGLTG